MKKFARISLLLAALTTSLMAGDQFLLRTPPGRIGELLARHKLTLVRALEGSGRNLFVVKMQHGGSPAALAADPVTVSVEADNSLMLPELAAETSLRANTSAVSHAARSGAVNFRGVQVLGGYVNQPAMSTVQLAGARVFASAGGGGIVAVLDTGVDLNHPALKDALVPGYDFTRNTPGASELADLTQSTTAILDELQSTTAILDEMQSTTAILDALQSTTAILDKSSLLVLNQSTTAILDQSTTAILDRNHPPAAFGHGTMVAGLVRLVAPNAKIMPVKVFTSWGKSSVSVIVNGIYYAVDHGAKVLNMSFSMESSSPELDKALDYAKAKGVICVAAAGNSGERAMVYPAGDPDVLGVGSTNNYMQRSGFSNYGNRLVSLAAPGEGVITLYPGNNYAAVWGTSFSAPIVSGGVALLVGMNGNLNQTSAEKALKQTIPIGQEMGSGELDLFLAALYQALHRW